MAKGDTKTESFLRAAAEGSREDLPSEGCCNTKTQNLILGVANRIMDVEDEVERLENNPDVVDIVATYADLEDYDTSGLTDKDIIRVLEDSTHNNNSTYYRWNSTTSQFDFVGEIVGAGGGGVKELTADDYNAPASNPTSVALALLEPGVYVWKNGVNVRVGEGGSNLVYNDGRSAIVGYGNAPSGSSLRKIVFIFGGASNNSNADVPMKIYTMTENLWTYETSKSILTDFSIVNVLTSTSTSRPLSANQGKVLNDKITALEARLGGLTLVSISQTDYDALTTKDPNTLYVITGA